MRVHSLLARRIENGFDDTMSRRLRGILLDRKGPSLPLLRFTRALVNQAALSSSGKRREFVGEVLAVLQARPETQARGPRFSVSAVVLLSRRTVDSPPPGARW